MNIRKGQNVAVAQVLPGASTVTVGLGWDVRQPSGPQTDVVPAVIACGADGKAISAEHVAFFNQLTVADASIQVTDPYSPDGTLDGDDERVVIDLAAMPSNIVTLTFVLYVNPDLRNPGTFAALRSAHVRLLDRAGGQAARYDLVPAELSGLSAVVAAELYVRSGVWKFRAEGTGFAGGITDVARYFGLPTD